jgi:glutathione S-transferase
MAINAKRSCGIPFKSKLRPYVDQIRKWRRAGFTWAAIAEKLGEQGCATCATNLYQFMRRYRKRPFPSGAEPETADLIAATTKPMKKTRPVIPRDSSTPYFEQLVDEAQEAARQIQERPVFNVVKPTRPL